MSKHPSRLTSTLLILLIAGYAAFFTTQLFLRYYSFGSRSLDLGNMDQAIWNTLHGRPFHQTNQPGIYNRLSLHVEPILLPISLLYLIHSGPESLFIFQSIIVALGAIPVFALARLKLKNEGLALIFALAYLMFPPLQGANLLDFHAVTLAPTFLLAAFYYLETQQPKQFAFFAVLAAACKEEISLLVMMMGVYVFFINRRRRLGLTTAVLSLGWTFLAVFVIPPAFVDTQNVHWNRYGHLGDSPFDIVVNFFVQPDLFLNHLQKVKALTYFRLLLTPTAFTALFSPLTLLLALPSLGLNLLSNFPPMQEINTLIYVAPIIPAIFISSIYGTANLLRVSGSGFHVSRFTHHVSRITFHVSRSTLNLLLGSLILIASLLYHAQYGFLPGGGQFRGWPKITDHHRRAAGIFAQIPPEAALSAHDRLNPHVSQRETLYIFDGTADDIDHIILDVTEDSWPLHPVELRDRVNDFLDDDFGVVDAFDGYLLLAKNQPNLPPTLPDAFFDFARVSDPENFTPQFPTSVTFDHKIRLLGYDLSLGAHQAALPVITLYWQALEPLAQDYVLWPFFIDRHGQLIEDPTERPLITTLWYSTSRWSDHEIILTSTLPYDLGDEFVLCIGLATRNWDDPSQRLPLTQVDETLYTFENNTWARLAMFRRTGRKSYEAVTPTLTRPQQPLQVQFWSLINLQGLDLPSAPLEPGEDLPFTLYWQSTAPLPIDLTTFAHLLDNQGNIVAQLDWIPKDSLGYLPTTVWHPNRLVVDSQTIPLPNNLPSGQYHLIAGWYYPVTGDRLPVTAGGSGDVAKIGTVMIQ